MTGIEERQIDVGPNRLAIELRQPAAAAARPGLVWLGGFMSDMTSSKAVALDAWCAAQGRGMLRFDYSGHGASGGRFADGTIGAWTRDALAVIRAFATGPLILVGSSMGAWIALLVAGALAEADEATRLAGMVLVAPAVDFTERLMWDRFDPAIRQTIAADGVWYRPSAYSDAPYPITKALIEDGRAHCLLGGTVRSYCPVHILQGMQDSDVPWSHAMLLVEHLHADPVSITLVKGGDHRLSGPDDIARLIAAVDRIA